ncbi:MAG: hypothetical protein ACKVU2_00450 [Saprospiraceae bacterium]
MLKKGLKVSGLRVYGFHQALSSSVVGLVGVNSEFRSNKKLNANDKRQNSQQSDYCGPENDFRVYGGLAVFENLMGLGCYT